MKLTTGFLLNNRYRILSTLGQGGMGAIYRALDENLGVPVAVKENLFLTDEYARQFQHEAHILASLHHPNLPRVRDYLTIPGQGQYMVMDYIEGEDLRTRIDRLKYLPEKEALMIGIGICEALSFMHSRQPPVVHRDVKPGNIRITPVGHVVLVDFGLAKVLQGNQVTTTGARAMTPGYSPPEQYGTGRTDARTDIYSLGATLYAALTGVIPEDSLERATGKADLTPLRTFQPRVSRRTAAVIEKSLAVDPAERYQTAEEFRLALIEAAEISEAWQSRPLIAPPPQENDAGQAADLLESSDEDSQKPEPRTGSNSSPLKWLPALLVFAVFFSILAVVLNPSLVFKPLPSPAPTSTVPPPTAAPTSTSTEAVLSPSAPQESRTPVPLALTSTAPVDPTTTRAASTPIGGSQKIAFASNRSGSMQIWLMNADGTQPEQLTFLPNGACQPNWSPDGEKIAFISPCAAKSDSGYPGGRISIMDADGSNVTALPVPFNPEGDYDPRWSPDGKRIAYVSMISGMHQILVYSFDDNVSINISNSKFNEISPAWSPDGKMIAFSRQTVGAQIYLMGDHGENPSQVNLSDANYFSQDAVFTPDGKYIIFCQFKTDSAIPYFVGMRVTDQGSTREIRIPPSGQGIGPVSDPSISPDGTWMVFESWPDGKNHDIFRMMVNGADRAQITSDPSFDFGPVWRPITRNP